MAWGVTLPEQKKALPTIALSLAFLRMPGLFVSAAARFVRGSLMMVISPEAAFS
ncbi:MAG TPA: hypothetical protein VGB43_07990 [Flavobacterium sp.]